MKGQTIVRLVAAALVGLVASLVLSACGDGIDNQTAPSAPSQTASANGNGNCVAVGNNNHLNCSPQGTPTPAGSPASTLKVCEVAYVVMNGPDTLASGDQREYSITPMNVDEQGKITEVPADCNIPRGPRVRWTVSGANASIAGAAGCELLPGENPTGPLVCGFAADVRRVAAGQFSITAVVPAAGARAESRGVTRYIN